MIKICRICNKKFETHKPNKVTCSAPCVSEFKKLWSKENNIKKRKIKNCPICNKQFISTEVHYKYCSDECSEKGIKKYYYERNTEERIKLQKLKIKICNICGKEFETYYPRKISCSKECGYILHEQSKRRNVYERTINWRKNNPEKYKLQIDRQNEKSKTNEKIKKYRIFYNNKNKEKRKEAYKNWELKNKDHKYMLNHKRRVKIKEAKGYKDRIENFRKRMNDIGECIFCGSKKNLTIEHLIPVSKGGTNEINNLFPSCKKCNCSKGPKDWIKWYREKDFYSLKREKKILKLCS